MRKCLKIMIAFVLHFALSGFGMEHNISSRYFTNEDRFGAVNNGVQYYMERYRTSAYFIKIPAEKNKYRLLGPQQTQEKAKNLISDANQLMDCYLAKKDKRFHALVLEHNGKDIGGLFYRVLENGVLMIDEIVVDAPDDLIQFILTDFLRKREPQCHTHKIYLRHINTEELLLFESLKFEPQDPEETKKYGIDPILYLGLTKTFE